MFRKFYHKILVFIIDHKILSNTIGKTKWFNKAVIKEAKWIIWNKLMEKSDN